MIIYNAAHPGQPTSATPDNAQLQGFFPKNTLENLINQPDAAGIRFYNAPSPNRLVAIGVTGDGSELRQNAGEGYFLSPTAPGGTAERLTKPEALAAVETAKLSLPPDARPALEFSSFFSKTMLANLLAPKNGVAVAGVRFFKTTGLRTHIGVSLDANGNLLQAAPGDLPARLLSDKPCPGTCATVAEGTAQRIDTIKYLINWSNM